jgi:hypothetical protein
MNIFSTGALFLCVLGAEAFAQSKSVQQIGPLAYQHLNFSVAGASLRLGVATLNQRTAVNPATSQTNAPLVGQVSQDGMSGVPLRLWPPAYRSFRTPAKSAVSAPFAYTTVEQDTRCSSGVLEPFQVASCIGLPGFDRPAITRLQNLAAHVMRHYNWQGNVGMNRTCVRSMSCSSLYEKSVLQRMAVRPPN